MALRFSPNGRRRNTLGLARNTTSRRRFRRLGKPSIDQAPTNFRELSSQLEIGYRILWDGDLLERPSVHGGYRKPETHRKRSLRQPERLQFLARHPPMINQDTMTVNA